MKKLISILMLAGLVSACAAEKEWVLTKKAGASKEELEKDWDWCNVSGEAAFFPFQREEIIKKNGGKKMSWEQWVAECMKSHGHKAKRIK